MGALGHLLRSLPRLLPDGKLLEVFLLSLFGRRARLLVPVECHQNRHQQQDTNRHVSSPREPLLHKEYWYLPDFYLPELNFWIEIKGPNPTREELERAFILSSMAGDAGRTKLREAKTEAERSSAFEDFLQQGVYIVYGDIPWPFPQKGNIFGFGARHHSGSGFFDQTDTEEPVARESQRNATEYRELLMGQLNLCWQECPLCLKIGVGMIGAPYCRACHDHMANHIRTHLAEYRGTSGAGRTKATRGSMNPEFFASGHKSPKLQGAYNAARSARFEHGQSPE